MNWHRIEALIYRHLMLLYHDLGKVLDTFYWPLIDIFSWGFLSVYITEKQVAIDNIAGILLSAIILWTLVYTVARDVTISFLDDIWDRNVVNLYCSPLKPVEFLASSLIVAVLRVILTTVILISVAFFFYSFNILVLGIYLILFFLILVIFSYSMGIFATALIMRFGPGVEVFAWSIPAVLAPISGIFYPLSILPPFIQKIAYLFPTSYIFEGMRGILTFGTFDWQTLFSAALLDLGFLILAFVFFYKVFNDIKKNGLIARFS